MIDYFMQPKFTPHPQDQQQELDQITANLSVFQFQACPFCVKVRWALRRMGLNVEFLDAKNNQTYRQELLSGGGKIQVPCLRINHKDGSSRWLYESDEIIKYFQSEVLPKAMHSQ